MNSCPTCGIPWDAGFFDDSNIVPAPAEGEERLLARYQLPRNYCGVLMSFAQFTDRYARDPSEVATPGYQWEVRCNGRPRDPYLNFQHIINPWASMPFPLYLRLEEGCLLELVVRRSGLSRTPVEKVGGRIVGRYWYNPEYGGVPHPL
jgi:hypothetical protein